MVTRNCTVITAIAMHSGILANSGNSPASRPLFSPNGSEMSAAAVTRFHDPGERHAPLRPWHPHAAQPRHQVITFADEERGEGAEDDAVDMDRPQPAEGQLERAAEIVRVVEQARQQHADRRCDQEPEHAPKEPDPHHRPIDQLVEVDTGKFATQHCPCLRHGAPPSKRLLIAKHLSGKRLLARQGSVLARHQHRAGVRPSDVGLQGFHRVRVGVDLLPLVGFFDAPVDHLAQA